MKSNPDQQISEAVRQWVEICLLQLEHDALVVNNTIQRNAGDMEAMETNNKRPLVEVET